MSKVKKGLKLKAPAEKLTALRRLCKYGLCGVWFLAAMPILMLVIGLETRLLSGSETPFPVLTLLAAEGIVIVIGVIGYALSSALDDLNQRFSWIRNIVIALACLVVWVLAFSLPFTLIMRIGLGVCTLTSFYLGSRFYYSSYVGVLKPSQFRGLIIFHLIAVFLMWIGQLPKAVIILALELALATVLHIVSENQINLENMMERRHQTFNRLPNRIRGHNLRLTLIGLGITFIFFIFSKWIMAGLWWLIKLIVQTVVTVISFLKWLANLLFGGPEAEDPLMVTSSSDGMFSGTGSPEKNDTVLFLLLILIAVMAFIYLRKPIWNAFCRIVDRIGEIIRRWMFKTFVKKDFSEGIHDYTDHEERVNKETRFGKDLMSSKKSAWQQGYRAFKKQRDPMAKYREGYRLIESWSALNGNPVALPDTVTERLAHMGNKISQKGVIAKDYCSIKYGTPQLEALDLAILEETLAELSKHMPTSRAFNRTIKN